jgi:hypothetical protein
MLNESLDATVSMNEKFICVETFSGRGLMGRDPGGVCDFHDLDVSDEVLGRSLRGALNASRWISMEEYPLFFDHEKLKQVDQAWVGQVMRTFEYRTERAVYRNMLRCMVDCSEHTITMRPLVHVKLEAWSGERIDPSQRIELPDAVDDVALGRALRTALSRCR